MYKISHPLTYHMLAAMPHMSNQMTHQVSNSDPWDISPCPIFDIPSEELLVQANGILSFQIGCIAIYLPLISCDLTDMTNCTNSLISTKKYSKNNFSPLARCLYFLLHTPNEDKSSTIRNSRISVIELTSQWRQRCLWNGWSHVIKLCVFFCAVSIFLHTFVLICI